MDGSTEHLPTVLVWIRLLSVPFLGVLATWIAWQQWRTARQKVQLDLFDRRLAIYEDARLALAPVLRENGSTLEEFLAYRRAIDRASFLFGPEVYKEFEEVGKAINQLMMHKDMMSSGPPYDEVNIKGSRDSSIRIQEFYENMPKLLIPYMQIDHKELSIGSRLRSWWRHD